MIKTLSTPNFSLNFWYFMVLAYHHFVIADWTYESNLTWCRDTNCKICYARLKETSIGWTTQSNLTNMSAL